MITEMEYLQAVAHLADVALNQDGSAALVAASVLISANSGAFTVSIPDLCLLDPMGFEAAMTVIAGRVLLGRDVERVIDNGEGTMREIYTRWRDVLQPETTD